MLLVAVLFGGLLSGCMEWDYGQYEDFNVKDNGLFITNEGNFQYGNATLSFYNPETKEFKLDSKADFEKYEEIFERENRYRLKSELLEKNKDNALEKYEDLEKNNI